jgi:uncharacterized membrane protein (UPF0136 family)
MKQSILSMITSVGIGIGFGIAVALFSGLISGFFTSDSYANPADAHHWVQGVTLGYAVIYSLLAVFSLKFLTKDKNFIFPVFLVVMTVVANSARSFSQGFSNLDCGENCDPAIVPAYAQRAATSDVHLTLIALCVIFLAVLAFTGWKQKQL